MSCEYEFDSDDIMAIFQLLSGKGEEVIYGHAEVLKYCDITARQKQYFIDSCCVHPEVASAKGRGKSHKFSAKNMLEFKLASVMLEYMGITQVRRMLVFIRWFVKSVKDMKVTQCNSLRLHVFDTYTASVVLSKEDSPWLIFSFSGGNGDISVDTQIDGDYYNENVFGEIVIHIDKIYHKLACAIDLGVV